MGPTSLILSHSPSLLLSLQNPNPRSPASSSLSTVSATALLHHRPPLSLSLNHRRRLSPLSVEAISKSEPKFQPIETLTPIFSVIKTPLCVAITAAALLFTPFPTKPPLALAGPAPAATETKERKVTEEEIKRERKLEDYVKKKPKDKKALEQLMNLKLDMEKVRDAIEIVTRIIEIEPDEMRWPLLRSHMYGYIGESAKAKEGFEAMIEKDPLFVQGFHGLVMVAGNIEDDWKSSIELEKLLDRIDAAMERCGKEGNWDKVRDFKFLVAQIRFFNGENQGGLKVYEELVQEDPTDFRPYLCQGIILTMLGRKDEAEKRFDMYKRLLPRKHPYAETFDETMMSSKVQAAEAEHLMAEAKAKANI